MELLFRRKQKEGLLGRVRFKLWSKLELDEEEQELIFRYKFDKAKLIEANQPGLMKKAFWIGFFWFLGLAIYLIFFDKPLGFVLNSLISIPLNKILEINHFRLEGINLTISLLAGSIIGYWYYHQRRETVYVRDLIYGRHFTCRSVVELARKEAWLETISSYLRQVMESAKHWDGAEHVSIKALPKDEAKQVILKGI